MLRPVVHHLRRYPKWYAVAAAWAIAIALLPVVHNATAAPRRTTPAALDTPATVDQALAGLVASPSFVGDFEGPATRPSVDGVAVPGPTASTPSKPSTPATPAPTGGLHIPPPPSIPIPTLPAALDPLLAAVAPVSADACGLLGISRVALSLVPSLIGGPIPLGDLAPYFTPLFTACTLIPLPATRTTCALDAMIMANEPAALVGIYTIPPLVGLAFDQAVAVLALGGLGAALPPLPGLGCVTK